jgi:hypothetical protein
VIGIRSVWACVALARWVIIGCLATVAVLAVAQPWWIDRSLALARYLLPLAPVVLLCISVGAIQCAEFAATRMRWHGTASNALVGAFVIALVATLWETGPFDELLRRPNSYTQHSYFQYDYRRETNLVRLGLALYPASGFWKTLAAKDAGSLTVAVAPFRYSTYEWPAPIWESESRQRVIPAFVWGTCEKQRHGEVPPAKGFHLANAVHLADAWSGFPQRVDYLAFYYGPRWPDVSPRMPHCEAWMRERLGAPAYEDGTLIAWHNPTLP